MTFSGKHFSNRSFKFTFRPIVYQGFSRNPDKIAQKYTYQFVRSWGILKRVFLNWKSKLFSYKMKFFKKVK